MRLIESIEVKNPHNTFGFTFRLQIVEQTTDVITFEYYYQSVRDKYTGKHIRYVDAEVFTDSKACLITACNTLLSGIMNLPLNAMIKKVLRERKNQLTQPQQAILNF